MQIRSFENRAFLALVALITLTFLWLIGGFLLPVFWAAVLAILFTPVYRLFKRLLFGQASLAALTTVLFVVVVVVAPIVGIGAAMTGEALRLYRAFASGQIDLTQLVDQAEQMLPVLTEYARDFGVDFTRVREGLSNAALQASQSLATVLLGLGQQTVRFAIYLVLTLYLLFFFLREGRTITDALVRALPLGDQRERRLFVKFADVVRATAKGTVVVGAVQGTLGGVTFWILGIGSPVLLGVLMALLAMVPALGAAGVWVPTALVLLAMGSWEKAVAVILVGGLVISTIDNFLRPILVGRDVKVPDYVILVATLGGIVSFGVTGVVIGPIAAALLLTIWEIFMEEFSGADESEAGRTGIHRRAVPGAGHTHLADEPVPVVILDNDDVNESSVRGLGARTPSEAVAAARSAEAPDVETPEASE